MFGPSRRDLERSIEQADDDPESADPQKTWIAFLNATHPLEMSTKAESDLLRRHWASRLNPDVDPRDMTGEQIAEFDRQIRRALETKPTI